MKSKISKLLIVVLMTLGFLSAAQSANAWHRGYDRGYYDRGWHHGYYRGGYHCRWVQGFWRNGYWHPARRVCWRR